MQQEPFLKIFPKKLKSWAFHCAINALPSYLIVMVWFRQWGNPVTHVAMGCAILTFIFAYSVLTSLPGPLNRPDTLFSRALRVGLIVRMIISILTMITVPTGVFLLFTPDLWCGQLAYRIVETGFDAVGKTANLGALLDDNGPPGSLSLPGFLEIYLTTILEGLILSFMLFIFSVVAIVILQKKSLKKLYSSGHPTIGG